MILNKGQLRIEFIFSVVIFAAFLFIIINFINTSFSDVATNVKSDIIKIKAETTLIFLIEDKNGFAIEPYILNKSKIIEYNKNCTNVTNMLKLNNYRLLIYNSSSILMECGYYSIPIVSLKRNILLKSENIIENGNLTLELW